MTKNQLTLVARDKVGVYSVTEQYQDAEDLYCWFRKGRTPNGNLVLALVRNQREAKRAFPDMDTKV